MSCLDDKRDANWNPQTSTSPKLVACMFTLHQCRMPYIFTFQPALHFLPSSFYTHSTNSHPIPPHYFIIMCFTQHYPTPLHPLFPINSSLYYFYVPYSPSPPVPPLYFYTLYYSCHLLLSPTNIPRPSNANHCLLTRFYSKHSLSVNTSTQIFFLSRLVPLPFASFILSSSNNQLSTFYLRFITLFVHSMSYL